MDFPGGPVVKTQCFHCKEHGLSPGQGTKIPHASQHGRKIEGKKKGIPVKRQARIQSELNLAETGSWVFKNWGGKSGWQVISVCWLSSPKGKGNGLATSGRGAVSQAGLKSGNWETDVLSPVMFIFQSDRTQVLSNDSSWVVKLARGF